jgi:hypothetical protein
MTELLCRQHHRQNYPYHLRSVLAGRSFQRIRTFKRVWTRDLHLPPVIRLRADNRHLPIAASICEQVLNNGRDFRSQRGVAGIVHFHIN